MVQFYYVTVTDMVGVQEYKRREGDLNNVSGLESRAEKAEAACGKVNYWSVSHDKKKKSSDFQGTRHSSFGQAKLCFSSLQAGGVWKQELQGGFLIHRHTRNCFCDQE